MDIVLEVFDSFVFDRLYATFLPRPAPSVQINDFKSNSTISSNGWQPSTWRYQPATKHISIQPSDYAYQSVWDRDDINRQAISLFLITWLFGAVIYITFAGLSYMFVFDKRTFNHPKYLKNQMMLEIQQSFRAMPSMAVLTTAAFLAEVRGYSRMYDSTAEGPGWWYDILQFPLFLLFTDSFIYWIHRGLHHPLVYKRLHKPHHKWVVPTPFASHAFHPLDGFAQSIPYHVFPFIFPLNKFAYIVLFTFINVWTVMIHDGEYMTASQIINGAACHTMHHLYFNFNYGQFTTLWDRLGGSYRKPNMELFLREEKMGAKEWKRQVKEAESFIKEVEGAEDDRVYLADAPLEAKKIQ